MKVAGSVPESFRVLFVCMFLSLGNPASSQNPKTKLSISLNANGFLPFYMWPLDELVAGPGWPPVFPRGQEGETRNPECRRKKREQKVDGWVNELQQNFAWLSFYCCLAWLPDMPIVAVVKFLIT